ncbi:PREDICTED: collagen alpha-1(I) chain-like, partial [Chinchilla lanigera]|uniref:collagen alpha-1(I) chain-like n=1 Tax=Chinchilla lanigera TaxID=34839 RepID=UPI000698E477
MDLHPRVIQPYTEEKTDRLDRARPLGCVTCLRLCAYVCRTLEESMLSADFGRIGQRGKRTQAAQPSLVTVPCAEEKLVIVEMENDLPKCKCSYSAPRRGIVGSEGLLQKGQSFGSFLVYHCLLYLEPEASPTLWAPHCILGSSGFHGGLRPSLPPPAARRPCFIRCWCLDGASGRLLGLLLLLFPNLGARPLPASGLRPGVLPCSGLRPPGAGPGPGLPGPPGPGRLGVQPHTAPPHLPRLPGRLARQRPPPRAPGPRCSPPRRAAGLLRPRVPGRSSGLWGPPDPEAPGRVAAADAQERAGAAAALGPGRGARAAAELPAHGVARVAQLPPERGHRQPLVRQDGPQHQ